MLLPLWPLLTAAWLTAGAAPLDPAQALPSVELRGAYERPTEHLGDTVRFCVQIDEVIDAWEPYHTRFGPERYRAYRVWSDDQRLWDAKEFHTPLGRLFVERGSAADRSLARAARFQRFVIHGTVRQALLGQPWIEVEHAFRSAETVGEGTLLHAARAVQWLEKGALEMARQELQRALAPRLPQAVRDDLEALLAQTSPA